MLVGTVKEVKNKEFRVGLVPNSVAELVANGHKVIVESNAGAEIGFTNEDYKAAGAEIIATADEVFAKADMIVKVKEPQTEELKKLRKGQILFTYLHLAPDPEQTKGLLVSGCAAIAYETITDQAGRAPLLAPMSEVAGRLAIQSGAHFLEKTFGGSGLLLSGVPGVEPGKVLVIGAGYAGFNAAKVASGMGANVVILDKNLDRLREIDNTLHGGMRPIYSTKAAIEKYIKNADLVVGAVYVLGDKAPKVVTKEMLKTMKKGSVMVDISIDQGGCFETSKATTHDEPTFVVDDIIHYCVANMPGAVAKTAAVALNNATLPFMLMLAKDGVNACKTNAHLMNGLNIFNGHVTHKAVAGALGLQYSDPLTLI